jgi:pimeloyl-ACP methyl ester carboxylesterase
MTATSPRALDLHRFVVGPPGAPGVLVLHGITESRRYWLPRILALAGRYRLVIPDLPGFGLSPKPFTDYTPEFFVRCLLDLVERELPGPGPLRIVGHSLGALLGLELAARCPGRIERLALVSLPRFNDPGEAHRVWFAGSYSYRNLLAANSLSANLSHVRRTGVRLTARYLRRLPWTVVSDSRRFTFRSLTSTLEHCLLHYRVDDTLARVPEMPILLIHGEMDQVAPLERMLDLPARPPHPVLHVIRGAGHHPLHTHAELCVELIESHLDGTPAVLRPNARRSFVVTPPRVGTAWNRPGA